jgi:hypothetical protein
LNADIDDPLVAFTYLLQPAADFCNGAEKPADSAAVVDSVMGEHQNPWGAALR